MDISLNYLSAYLKLLTAISTDAQNDQKTIKEVVAIGTTAASFIPDISATAASSALTALGTLATDVRGLVAITQISDAARTAQEPLGAAVRHLKRYYPKFLHNEQTAFSAWDECANERLIFIRDQPLGKIPSYRTTYFVTANGFDLDNAYQAYLTQRQSFTIDATVQGIDKLLDQIVGQNAKLADPGLTWETFQASVQSLNTLYNDLAGAASAVQNFGTQAKPVAAPKVASSGKSKTAASAVVIAWAN